VRLWYEEDERAGGVPPLVHVRALSNAAWLKKPRLCRDLKLRELVALCRAALRPSQETWVRFLGHLRDLEASKRLSSDEVTAIIVSAMSDQLLSEAEFLDDKGDLDAVTTEEIVARVQESYISKSKKELERVSREAADALGEAKDREREAASRAESAEARATEAERRYELGIQRRALFWARASARFAYWLGALLVAIGALELLAGHKLRAGLGGRLAGGAIAIFLILELIGILDHMARWRDSMESTLSRRFRRRLEWASPGSVDG